MKPLPLGQAVPVPAPVFSLQPLADCRIGEASVCAADELLLWRFLVSGKPFVSDEVDQWLTPAELARARRLPRPVLRHRFVAERIALRWIISRLGLGLPGGMHDDEAIGTLRDPNGTYRLEHRGTPLALDMAHAGLWLFVVLGRKVVGLAAALCQPGDSGDARGQGLAGSPGAIGTTGDDAAIAANRRIARMASLDKLAPGETVSTTVETSTHPHLCVPLAGRMHYLYDISATPRLAVVACADRLVRRVRGYGWKG